MKADYSEHPLRYWVQVFSVDTWKEFLDAGAKVTGFRENRWGFVQQLKPGDFLLCYVSRISRWVGILEVQSEPYLDTSPIWKRETYPCRADVRIVASLPVEEGVPIKDLADRLSIFSGPIWSLHLMASPTRWKEPDAKVVFEAIQSRT